jgi:hypothetical protein
LWLEPIVGDIFLKTLDEIDSLASRSKDVAGASVRMSDTDIFS